MTLRHPTVEIDEAFSQMEPQDSRYSPQDGGPAFKLHSIPLLSGRPAYDDPRLEYGETHSSRGSRGVPESHSEHTSPVSSIEPFPDFEDTSATFTTSTPRWRRLPLSRPSFYVWARRLRLGAEQIADGRLFAVSQTGRRRRPLNCVLFLLAFVFITLGVVHSLSLTLGAYMAFFPDDLDWVLEHWGDPDQLSEGLSHWPTDFTGDIRPVACHSHNDYWRKVPLYEAIHAGCVGVEADVWLFDEELYVGHNTYALSPNRTLKSLYMNPILAILEKQNPITRFQPGHETPPHGIFDTDPSQTLVLLIDFKTSGAELWPYLFSQLEPLREGGYLTYFNGTDVVEGPVTVVGTGNTPFDLLVSNTSYRDIFFDAPLDQMADSTQALDQHAPKLDGESDSESTSVTDSEADAALASSAIHHRTPPPPLSSRRVDDAGQGHSGAAPTDPNEYSYRNSYYASVSFKEAIGHVWRYRLSTQQLGLIRAQIRGAHERGLKVRYWDLPSWPRGLRNHVWHVLVREGVDILNVDDLDGATRRDWRRRKGWWF